MKGIIFNVLEEYINVHLGADVYEDILDELNLDGVYVGPGTYSNDDFLKIVTLASEKAKMDLNIVVKDFGTFTFNVLHQKFPIFMEPYSKAKDFILTIHGVIHVEVKKLYQDSELPDLFYEDISKNELKIDYHSPKKLCLFMEGLLDGVKVLYDEDFTYEQEQCCHKDNDFCRFKLKFNYE